MVPMLVLAELGHRCHERLGVHAWLVFQDDVLQGAYRIEAPTSTDLARCQQLQTAYADLGPGVVDASVVALVERLEETRVATLDPPPLHHSLPRPRPRAWPTALTPSRLPGRDAGASVSCRRDTSAPGRPIR